MSSSVDIATTVVFYNYESLGNISISIEFDLNKIKECIRYYYKYKIYFMISAIM